MKQTFYLTSVQDDIVLGMGWLKKYNPMIDWAKGCFTLGDRTVYCTWAGTQRLLRAVRARMDAY